MGNRAGDKVILRSYVQPAKYQTADATLEQSRGEGGSEITVCRPVWTKKRIWQMIKAKTDGSKNYCERVGAQQNLKPRLQNTAKKELFCEAGSHKHQKKSERHKHHELTREKYAYYFCGRFGHPNLQQTDPQAHYNG